MNKPERKNKLKIVEAPLRSGITTNNQQHIVDAYRHLEDLMNADGLFSLSEIPKFPSRPSTRCKK